MEARVLSPREMQSVYFNALATLASHGDDDGIATDHLERLGEALLLLEPAEGFIERNVVEAVVKASAFDDECEGLTADALIRASALYELDIIRQKGYALTPGGYELV